MSLLSMRVRHVVLLLVLTSFAGVAHAQKAGSGDDDAASAPGADAIYEAGFHLGNLLPNQIDGVSEIMSLGGLRGAFRLAPKSYTEFGIIMGNGEGVEWKNAHIDLRMDIPVENLMAVAFVGADTVMYENLGGTSKIVFGGHAGGGIQASLGGLAWFRADMKFGFSPGTSLYIGAGIVLRMGEGGASSGGGGT